MATAHEPDVEELINGVVRPTGSMTEDAFMSWCDEDVKAEWVDGEVVIMSPSNTNHVRLLYWLGRVMGDFVEDRGLGEMFGPELFVRFAGLRRRRVPDLFFIANERLGLLQVNHFEGAPDLIIEIVSPESRSRDLRDKYADYEAAGVREYWIIDPDEEELAVYALDASGRFQKVAADGDRVASAVIPGFSLRAGWLWQSPLPGKRIVLREMGLND